MCRRLLLQRSQSPPVLRHRALATALVSFSPPLQVLSYQFSVTEHLRIVDPRVDLGGGLLPGVFLNYELSPMRVRIEERRNSLGHFLVRVCAIIGGVFTVRLCEGVRHHRGRVHGEAM